MDYKTKLKNISKNTDLININQDSFGFVLSKLISNSSQNHFLHITQNEKEAYNLQKQVEFFIPQESKESLEILQFPAWDCLPFDRVSPKASIIAARINCLHKLIKKPSAQKTLVIANIGAVLQKTVPVALVRNLGFIIEEGEEVSIELLAQLLVDNGFSRATTANNVAEFAIRGNIVDIIVSQNQLAEDLIGYRLDFLGDVVENIKVFDPTTQLTYNKIKKINFLPASEINLNQKSIDNFKNNYRQMFGNPFEDTLYNSVIEGINYPGAEHFMPLFYDRPLSNIFDYLNQPEISFSSQIIALKDEKLKTIAEYYQARVATLIESKNSGAIYNPVPPEHLYLNQEEFRQEISRHCVTQFCNQDNLSEQNSFELPRSLDLEIKPVPNFANAAKANNSNAFELLKGFLQTQFINHKIIFACFSPGSKSRLERIMLDHKINSLEIDQFSDIKKLAKNQIGICLLEIGDGFYASDLMVVGESALLGEKINQQLNKKSAERILSEGINLEVGDLVVHRYQGIGKFEGLCNIQTSKGDGSFVKNDFLKISYLDGDSLFVLVEDINLITRYGAYNPLIKLDKLGGNNWQNRREKVRKKIKIAAEELIKIAAQRSVKKAPILICNSMFYEEFKAGFGFEETHDQLRSINEIEEDLQKGSPMDRLVCGDVGFGKTEVAMRAAFIATHNELEKYQVAIITPTTLLCRQHYHNFINRFRDNDIKIAQLSRMITSKEAKKIKSDLEEGKIDIIIGTHSLLGKEIKFKKLGLLIVDEEQHFGVIQKEKIKQLKNDVHILTLSATPIPRTLQMSLSGVKELSIISTAPIERMAVRNYVIPYDQVIIREAILREQQRGGRTFFVVPRIQDINNLQERLFKQIPEVKFAVAHGQMPANNLDKIMNDFYDGKFDVLLSTSIIESGIDVAAANTMIIYKSEHFGLAQLYQLRGRVGRGKIRGYCYFTTKVNKISEIAQKKLKVIQKLEALGAGFSIASHDMDIRGSGNILGDEQSGHIKETGAELYQSMLIQAIKEVKSANSAVNRNQEISQNKESEKEDYVVQIKLGISLLIPESYIADFSTKMGFYKRISSINSIEEQEQIRLEMIDRFGKMPTELENLIEIAYQKTICKKLNIEKLENHLEGILISFKNNHFAQGEKLLQMVFSSKNQIKLQGHKVLFVCKHQTDQEKLKNSSEALKKINNLL